MKYPSVMRQFHASLDAPLQDRAAHNFGIRDGVLVGLVLFTLVRSSDALAGDSLSILSSDPASGNVRLTPPTRSLLQTQEFFTVPAIAEAPTFSSTDFRPRRPSVFDSDPIANEYGATPMLRGTTVWQRLADYKSHDRVRLLTLWESRASTVSLQAGRRGDPSLQWTSRLMNRGGSTQGLLDRWFSVSLAGAGNRLRNLTRPASSAAPAKESGIPVVAGLK
jgi:hypothetical protein